MEKRTEQVGDNQEIQESEIMADEKSKESCHATIWIFLLLMFALNAGLYWLWFQQKKVNSQLQSTLDEMMTFVVDAPSRSEFDQEIAALEKQFQLTVAALKNKQISLAGEVDVLRANQNLTGADVEYYWVIAEVNYLLNVANQRALLANDANGAFDAIELADSRIEALLDHRFHPLRALFAEEKLALSAVNNVDIEGLILQIQSAVLAVDDLHILLAPSVESESSRQDSRGRSSDWRGALTQAWQQVKSLVVIRHQQNGTAAVLVPKQRYFLYQNLKLKLESAQLALLNGQQSVYDSSLSSASDWLNLYFIGDERDAMLSLITELREQNIAVSMPDISGSLTWLRGFEQ